MKYFHFFSIFFMTSLCSFAWAQTTELVEVQKNQKTTNLTKEQQDSLILAFPKFTAGTIIFKDMKKVQAEVNYNYNNQEFLFLDQSDHGAIKKLTNIHDVAIIKVGRRIFYPLSVGIGEVLIDGDVSLIESRKINVEEVKTGGYGTGGSTASISNLSSVNSGNSVSYSATQQNYSANASFMTSYRFFLLKEGDMFVANKKNFLKCYPTLKSFIEKYISEKKLDYENLADMQLFVTLCNDQLKK